MARWFWLGSVLVVLSGCATKSLLVGRFSKEHSCQKDAVSVRDAGGNIYVAEGCGHRVEYVCQSFAGPSGSEKNCVERGLNPNASPVAPTRPTPHNVPEPPK